MTEFRKEIGFAAVIAVMAAFGVGLVAITAFPTGLGLTSTSTPIVGSSTTTTAIGTGPSGPSPPVALTGFVYANDVSCSLATGVCNFEIVNNSTTSLELEACSVVVRSSGTASGSSRVNGTIGGPAIAGIPANSEVFATCTVPTTQLAHETNGSVANGTFMVKLVQSWYSYPAGTEATFGFEGTWS